MIKTDSRRFLSSQQNDKFTQYSISLSHAKPGEDLVDQILTNFFSDDPPKFMIGIQKIDCKKILRHSIFNGTYDSFQGKNRIIYGFAVAQVRNDNRGIYRFCFPIEDYIRDIFLQAVSM